MSKAVDNLSQQELETYLWGAATLLRGLVDAGDYKQFVFPLLFFKRITAAWDDEHAQAVADFGTDVTPEVEADTRAGSPEVVTMSKSKPSMPQTFRPSRPALRLASSTASRPSRM